MRTTLEIPSYFLVYLLLLSTPGATQSPACIEGHSPASVAFSLRSALSLAVVRFFVESFPLPLPVVLRRCCCSRRSRFRCLLVVLLARSLFFLSFSLCLVARSRSLLFYCVVLSFWVVVVPTIVVSDCSVVPPPDSFLDCEAVLKNTNKRARTATLFRYC